MKDLEQNLEAAAAKAVEVQMETNGYVTKEDLPEPLDTSAFATKEDIQLVSQQIEGMEVNSNRNIETETVTSFAEYFDSIEINGAQNDKDYSLNIELNAASTYTPSAGADSAPGREDRQVEIEYDPHQASLAMHFMQRTGGGQAYRLNTATSTSNAGGKAKGAAFGRTTKAVSDTYVPYITVGHVLTVPKEDLNDTNALQGYFEEEMQEEIVDTINSEVLTGAGGGSNLRGLTNWSAAKDQAAFETFYGDLADSYGTAANFIDVIVATAAGLEQDNFDKRTGMFKCFVRPAFMANIRGIKSSTGEYVLRTAWSPEDNMMKSFIGDVEIITSSAVATDTFHFFHTSAVKYVTREGMGAEVGYDTDDWSRNNISLKAYGRYALVSGKPNGIVNGTFANAILALNT